MPIKPFKKLKIFWIILVFAILVVGSLTIVNFGFQTEQTPLLPQLPQKKLSTVYPTQYSDNHITSNAIISDPKFKSLAIFSKDGLLANTISSLRDNPSANINLGTEKGTWLWTPVLEITPKYRDKIISGAKKNGITTIYMSVDSYLDIFTLPDGSEKDLKKKNFDKVVADFISTAWKSGITVDAEGGWRNWAENGNTYKSFAVLDYVKNFNATHDVRFRGFQYDIEPYLLDSYQKNKTKVLSNFLDLTGETISRLNRSDLIFSVVIPEFYDAVDGETPQFLYLGQNGSTFDHLVYLLDRRQQSKIIVMSYRNFSSGDDGTIDVSRDEILKADGHLTKVVIAQETGDVQPPYITFRNTSLSYLNKQLTTVQKTFSKDQSFAGVAIHYINAYMELK